MHACKGNESCAGGLCQPEVIVDASHGLNGIYHIAVQGLNLYGINNGAILNNGLVWSSNLTGGGFTYLTPPPAMIGSSNVGGMAIDATDVWFGMSSPPAAPAGTYKTPIAGTPSAVKVSGFYAVNLFAIDMNGGPYMYISDGFNSGFAREPKSGTPTPPTCGCFVYGSGYPAPTDLVTDLNGNVFWSMSAGAKLVAMATSAQVASWPAGQNNMCASTNLVTGDAAEGLGLDATYVYYYDSGTSKIKRVPIAGGPAVDLTASCTLPTGQDAPRHLVVDDARIYWAHGTGNVWAIPKDGSCSGGGTITPIVKGQPGQIWDVAFDAYFLYFGVSGSNAQVLRVSK
jgi:hypothetical protein